MTRINVGIEPKELPDKLLLAEHREITRIPNAVKSGRAKLDTIPFKFRLGKGHVKFFYNKLKYLYCRYVELYSECKRRKFKVTNKLTAFDDLPSNTFNDYIEQSEDRQILIERITKKGFSLLE